jgi:hypothetical protein
MQQPREAAAGVTATRDTRKPPPMVTPIRTSPPTSEGAPISGNIGVDARIACCKKEMKKKKVQKVTNLKL